MLPFNIISELAVTLARCGCSEIMSGTMILAILMSVVRSSSRCSSPHSDCSPVLCKPTFGVLAAYTAAAIRSGRKGFFRLKPSQLHE